MTNPDDLKVSGAWTVLIYIAADNELAKSAEKSLKHIGIAGSSASVRVAVQIDRGKGLGATRYVGENGTFSEGQNIGLVDTGDPKPLIQFLEWGLSICPAKYCLAVLWGHGAGLDQRTQGFTPGDNSGECAGSSRSDSNPPKAGTQWWDLFSQGIQEILHDYTTEHYLSNACLRFAVDEAKKATGQTIDILGLDACLMGMTEIVCDLRDSVRFAVTSEDTEPRASWPYGEIIGALVRNPDIPPNALGELIVKEYMASFPTRERRRGLTLSLCDLGKSHNLIAAVKDLSSALSDFIKTNGKSAIEKARSMAPRYDRDYVDLQGFCQALLNSPDKSRNVKVAKSSEEVIAALKDQFVVYSESVGRLVHRSNGISIFLPTDNSGKRKRSANPRSGKKGSTHSGSRITKVPKSVILIRSSYKALTFVKETGWDQFLLTYLGEGTDSATESLTGGGKMSATQTATADDRKKPNSPRKKPRRSGRKKPSGPRKKPRGRKKRK